MIISNNTLGIKHFIKGYKIVRDVFTEKPEETATQKRMKAAGLISKNIFGPTYIDKKTNVEWPHGITSPFGPRVVAKLDGNRESFHYGIDFVPRNFKTSEYITTSGKNGDLNFKIRALGEGTVIFAGFDKAKFGHHVILEHANGIQTVYAHLQKKPSVKQGSTVLKGDTLGYFGNSGKRSTGEHLHFEIRRNNNPLSAFNPTGDEAYQYLAKLTTTTSILAWNDNLYLNYTYPIKNLGIPK